MQILCYSGKEAAFYIQCKGNNSGQPLKKPIPNCFSVFDAEPLDFYIVQALFVGRYFEPHITGSVVPFIRIDDVREVVRMGKNIFKPSNLNKLEALNTIDDKIAVLIEQQKLYKQLRTAFCRSLFK